MPKNARILNFNFKESVNSLEKVRRNYDDLVINSLMENSGAALGYSGLFLSLFTEFENIISNLFFGLLRGEIVSESQGFRRKVELIPISEAENVVYNGKPYIDWLPII